MPLLGGTIETPRDLYLHKLGAALKMEHTILEMLPELEEHARDKELKKALRQHLEETKGHVTNLERAFKLLGEEVDDSACPTIEGLEKEGEANLKMVDDNLNDQVILSGVGETEHHEIAVSRGPDHDRRGDARDGGRRPPEEEPRERGGDLEEGAADDRDARAAGRPGRLTTRSGGRSPLARSRRRAAGRQVRRRHRPIESCSTN